MGTKLTDNRDFYRRVLHIMLPILVQNCITFFVSLLDNIMVGQVGTEQMSGISIANQLIMVFNLTVFGANSGAGIFTAQYHGSQDDQGIRHCLRYKILLCTLLTVLGVGVFWGFGPNLIGFYLQGEGDPASAGRILEYSYSYMKIMLLGLLPFALNNAYSSTLRECGRAVPPMIGSIVAVLTNLILNYVLIFGKFGAPALGADGAAIATVISRFVELGVVAVYSHTKGLSYMKGLLRSFRIPRKLALRITVKGTPLMLNEFLWSMGIAMLTQSYSTCGLNVVPALNIAETLNNLSNVVVMALGNTVGIVMGQLMGSGCGEAEIRAKNRKLLYLSVLSGLAFGVVEAVAAPLFPQLYNTTEDVRTLAMQLMLVYACMKPVMAYVFGGYFTLRSGGQTMIALVFDGGFMWLLTIPLAFCLSRFTGTPILILFILCNSVDFVKCIAGWYLLRKGSWIQNLAVHD